MVQFPAEAKIFFFSKAPRPALGPNSLPFGGYRDKVTRVFSSQSVQLHLVPRLHINGAVPPLAVCTGDSCVIAKDATLCGNTTVIWANRYLCMKVWTADINSCCAQYCYSNANITVNYTLTECCVVVPASSHIHGRRGTLNSRELRQLAYSIQANINLNYVHCAVHTLPVSYNKTCNVRATLHCNAFALLLLT